MTFSELLGGFEGFGKFGNFRFGKMKNPGNCVNSFEKSVLKVLKNVRKLNLVTENNRKQGKRSGNFPNEFGKTLVRRL